MKLSPKMRIIALCAVLVLVIAAGVFILTRDSDTPEEPVTAENTPDNQAGQAPDDASQPTTVSEPPMIYVEEQLATSDTWPYLYSIYRYSGGGAVYNNGQMLDIVTQDVICDVPQEWLSTYGEDNYAFAFDEDDRLYLAAYDPEQGMLIISKDDAGQDVLLPLPEWVGGPAGTEIDLDNLTIEKLMVDSDYIYLLSRAVHFVGYEYTLQIFTRDGALHEQYDAVSDFDLDGSGAIYIAFWDYGLSVMYYEISSGDSINSAWGEGFGGYRQIAIDQQNKVIYAATTRMVQRLDIDSGLFLETVFNTSDVMLDTGRIQRQMYVLPDATIFLTAEERNGSYSLYRYTYEEDTRHNMPYTLTITAPYWDAFLSNAIRLYESKNPDQHILYDYTYNSLLEYRTNYRTDKFFDQLNLDILAGTIGDIIVTGFDNREGNYDPYPYFHSDLFIDLTDLIQNDLSYEVLDKAVFDCLPIGGAIRGLPASTGYYYAEINLDLCEQLGIEMDWQNAKWSDILSLVDELEDTDYFLLYDSGDVGFINRLMLSNMPDLINRETGVVDIQQDWFMELLRKWKAAEQSPNFKVLRSESDVDVSQALISLLGDTRQTYEGENALDYAYYDLEGIDGMRVQIVPMFCGELNPNRLVCLTDMYSISAHSENQDTAWDFLSFMLSDEVQYLQPLMNRPVNVKIRNLILEESISDFYEEDLPIGRQYISEMQNVYSLVNNVYGMEELLDPMGRLARGYVYGAETLDEALATCERELRMIMNES